SFIAPVPLQPIVNPPRPLFAGIDYDGSAASLTLDGTDDVNIFNVQPSPNTVYHINGNLQGPVLDPQGNPHGPALGAGVPKFGGGDYLMLDTTGTSNRRLHISSLGSGFWTFTSQHQRVNFTNIERFNHVAAYATATDNGGGLQPQAHVWDAETDQLL